uniref:Uncharacterized protein n=1 Tax=Solanum lycopersicum TaxID=4081 RepID=A0A3Q7IUN1_SOLLC
MQSQILGYIAAMKIKKKSKFLNNPIALELNDEFVISGSYKRKEGSTMKLDKIKIDKTRKVKYIVLDTIGKHGRTIEPLHADLKGNLKPIQFNQFKYTMFGEYTKMHYQEFAITIGLNCFADKYDLFSGTSEPKRLINQYFEGKSIIRKAKCIPRLVNWRTRNIKVRYEFLIEGMFSDKDNLLKYKNIQSSFKEIAFYQPP